MKWLWLSVIIVIADQGTKFLASHYLQLHDPVAVLPGLNLTLMHNTGAAFSIFSQAGGWQRWFFIGLAIAVSIALLIWMHSLSPDKRWLACSLALILGGAAGNVIDRLATDGGYVIDFIDIYYKNWHWPAFNVADSAITVGAIMLIIDTFWLSEAKVSV